ncbi:MAG: hypothetical protein AB8B85_17190, partial [Paracoccaceae bacterium]
HQNSYSVNVFGNTNPSFVAGACAEDFIGDHYQGNSSTESQVRSDMQSYWSDKYAASASGVGTIPPIAGRPVSPIMACGIQSYVDTVPGLAEYCEASNLSATLPTGENVDTWYEVYLVERFGLGNAALFTDTDGSLPTRGYIADPTDNTNWILDTSVPAAQQTGGAWSSEYVTRYGLSNPADDYVKQTPDDYFGLSPDNTLYSPARERRRLRAAMVNCGASVGAGASGTNSNEYEVNFEDVRVLDVYLPQPAGYHCGSDTSGSPIPTCDVEDSKDTVLHMEIIRDVTDEATTKQFVAKLVR